MTSGSRAGRVAVVVLALTSHGLAQSPKAEADALFKEGRRLIKAGKITAGCEKLEASDRLDPEEGTKLSLADCWARAGRAASASALFVKIAGTTKREDRAAEARRRVAELKAELVHLTIEVDDPELEELIVMRNEQVVDRASWNQPVPVDPDEYTITAKAPKHEKWTTTIKVKTKDKVVTVPKLERVVRKRTPKKAPDSPNPYRGASIGLIVAGGAAIGIATGVAFHSKSLQNQSDALCPETTCSDLRGVDLNHRARTEGWIANIGWGLGGAAIAAAIVTWSIGGKKKSDVSVTPVVTDDRAGVVVGGRF